MNRKPSVCLNDLLNQYPPRKSKLELNSKILQIIPEQSCSHQMQQIKKRNFQKLLTSDFSNSLDKIEFARQVLNKKNEPKKYHSFKDAIKLIHEEFLESFSKQNNKDKQVVPDFIRQRDLQKREMQKIIIQNNSQYQETLENKANFQVIFIEILLSISIIYMWIQIIDHFSNK